MKYLFIVLMWLICPLGSASEFEIKPTHIISNKFSWKGYNEFKNRFSRSIVGWVYGHL
jgi:hypothetical protein